MTDRFPNLEAEMAHLDRLLETKRHEGMGKIILWQSKNTHHILHRELFLHYDAAEWVVGSHYRYTLDNNLSGRSQTVYRYDTGVIAWDFIPPLYVQDAVYRHLPRDTGE